MKKECVLFDLDGTLADTRHRLHHLRRIDEDGNPKKQDWAAFFRAAAQDPPYYYAVMLYKALQGHLPIIIPTARPETYRALTVEWLDNLHLFPSQLLMRDSGDYRPDVMVKRDMFESLTRNNWKIVFVVEDRTECVKMWRANGVPCLQADDSDWVA